MMVLSGYISTLPTIGFSTYRISTLFLWRTAAKVDQVAKLSRCGLRCAGPPMPWDIQYTCAQAVGPDYVRLFRHFSGDGVPRGLVRDSSKSSDQLPGHPAATPRSDHPRKGRPASETPSRPPASSRAPTPRRSCQAAPARVRAPRVGQNGY